MGTSWSYLLALGTFGVAIAAGVYTFGGYSLIKGIQNYQASRRLSDAATFFLIGSILSWILVLLMAYVFIRLFQSTPLPTFLLVICVLIGLVIGILSAAAAEYIATASTYKPNSSYSEARSHGIIASILGFTSLLLVGGLWATEPHVTKVEAVPAAALPASSSTGSAGVTTAPIVHTPEAPVAKENKPPSATVHTS